LVKRSFLLVLFGGRAARQRTVWPGFQDRVRFVERVQGLSDIDFIVYIDRLMLAVDILVLNTKKKKKKQGLKAGRLRIGRIFKRTSRK
jgi:hypothetical protein